MYSTSPRAWEQSNPRFPTRGKEFDNVDVGPFYEFKEIKLEFSTLELFNRMR